MYIGKLSASSGDLHIQSINRSAALKNRVLNGKKEENTHIDTVTISSTGKKQSMIEQLLKQKELLQEQKQSLLNSAAESKASGLDAKLKDYEQQMKDIDQQINELQTDDMTGKKEDDKADTVYKEPKTKEDIQKEQLGNLNALSNGTNQAKVIASVKNRIDGNISVLSSEIHYGLGNTSSKIEKIMALERQSKKLPSEIADKLGESMESISAMTEDASEPGSQEVPVASTVSDK